jgi:hypothetical protein
MAMTEQLRKSGGARDRGVTSNQVAKLPEPTISELWAPMRSRMDNYASELTAYAICGSDERSSAL